MPFKTKKKKQAALKNRVAVSASGSVSYSGFAETKEQVQRPDGVSSKHQNALDLELNLPRFKGELVKIVLLAILIIGFQLALKFSNLPFLK